MQLFLFMVLFAVAVVCVAVSNRRKKRWASRCRLCGRTLDRSSAKGDLCVDCWRLERI